MTTFNDALQAIRTADVATSDVRAVLAALASAMGKSGFSDLDVEQVDQVADFVCGEMA